jgi:hypothetical protein
VEATASTKKSSNSVATSVGKLVDTAGEHDREKSEAEGSKNLN